MVGNKSFDYIFMEDYYQLTSLATRSFYVIMVATCNPDIDDVMYMNYSNFEITLNNPEKNPLKTSAMIMGSNQGNIIQIISVFKNFHIYDVDSQSYSLVWMAALHDIMYTYNLTLDNVNSAKNLMFISFYKETYVNDFTYKNSANQIGQLVRFFFMNKLQISDFKLQNYTGEANPVAAMLEFFDRTATTVLLDNFRIENCNLKRSRLILGSLLTDAVTISNFRISNSTMTSGDSFIKFPRISQFEVSNVTIHGFETSDFDNSETHLFGIEELNLGSDYPTEVFENLDVRNSSVSFLKISSFLDAPRIQKSIYFANMIFRDMYIQTRSILIDTEGLTFDSKLRVEFSNLTFDNVSYSVKGYLLNLAHFSSEYLIIKDSSFTNLNSAEIQIGSVSSPTESAKVKFVNSKFNLFYSEVGSLISVYNEAVVEVQN